MNYFIDDTFSLFSPFVNLRAFWKYPVTAFYAPNNVPLGVTLLRS